jgi:hypothetical protein
MKLLHQLGASLFLSLVMSACNATPPPATGDVPASSAKATGSSLDSVLKKDMPYADLRQTVLGQGWKPKVDLQCKANVVGADYEKQCAKDPGMCKVCDNLPELSSCSGDGACLMHFQKPGQTLKVVTYGSTDDWNVHGASSQMNVTGWSVAPETQAH